MSTPLIYKRKNDFTDIWVVKQGIKLSDIILEKEEVENVKWVSIKELRQMIDNGRLYRYSDDYFELLSKHIKI